MRLFINLIFLLIFSFGYSQISSGQLLYYPFNGNVTDISGNNNNGSAYGGITYTVDRFGNANSAIRFDGINDYVQFPNIAQLKPALPLSFSFWIKYDNISYQNQVVFNPSFEENRSSGVWFNSTSASNNYAVNYGDESYAYTESTRNAFVSDTSIIPNVWHHIVVVVTSQNDMKIYVDCQYNSGYLSGYGGDLTYSSTAGCIGRHDRSLTLSPDYFKGTLDDFRYWNRELTVSEINLLCNSLSVAENTHIVNEFEIYPNPASDYINVETNIDNLKTLVIYNSVGTIVYSGDFMSKIDVSSFSSGIYFVKANSDAGSVSSRIVIK